MAVRLLQGSESLSSVTSQERVQRMQKLWWWWAAGWTLHVTSQHSSMAHATQVFLQLVTGLTSPCTALSCP